MGLGSGIWAEFGRIWHNLAEIGRIWQNMAEIGRIWWNLGLDTRGWTEEKEEEKEE